MDDESDSLVGTLNLADGGNYPNMLKLSEIASVSPVGLTEAERAASTLSETDLDLFIWELLEFQRVFLSFSTLAVIF